MAPLMIRGFKGMDNVHSDFELPLEVLRNAVNVDVLDSGKLKRARGFAEVISGRTHSAWQRGDLCLFWKAGSIWRLNVNDTATELVTGVSDRPVSYTFAGQDVHWANGAQMGRISNGVSKPWGVEEPGVAPSIAAGSGSLAAGLYQTAVTFVDDGEESAASQAARVQVTAGGLTITVPQPSSADVTGVNVYLTPPNDKVFSLVAELPVGTTSLTLVTRPPYGRELRTQHMRRFLPCDLLTLYRGAIYGAVSNILFHTEQYYFGVHNPKINYYVFPNEIRVIAGMVTGMYVVTDKTIWLEGSGPSDFTEKEVLPYGAAKRSLSYSPDSKQAFWFGERGLVMAGEGGDIKELMANRVMPDKHDTGATIVREQNSMKQIIGVVGPKVQANPLQAQDYIDMEVIRAADLA